MTGPHETGTSVAILKPDRDAIAIGKLWRKACQTLVESTCYYIECGRRLTEKKDELGHGNWLPWLADNAEVLVRQS
jgi:hypothetical protein